MARVSEITYTNIDIVKLLLKDQGIDEGQWMLQVNFGFKALNAPGTVEGEFTPGILVIINHLGIKRIDDGTPATPGITVDARTGEPVGTIEELQASSKKA